jgi:hypothetical protein
MIVRELIATFGIDFDNRGAKRAESAMGSLKSGLSNLGIAFSAGAVAAGLGKFIGLASDVDENMNVLQQTFQEQTQGVLDWAKTTGDAMGRSEYSMREYAASLGAILAPTLGNRKAAADMSTQVSGLAVDLASFFNMANDQDALERLRSGLLGSTEAVDQLGINLRVESLQAFAASRGITKTYKSMTEAEKVHLRFNKIMADTVDKQGDAARTGGGWAGSSKRLKDSLEDVGRAIGKKLKEPATEVVGVFGDLAKRFSEVAQQSNMVEGVLATLGALAVGFGIRMGLANLPLLLFAGGLALIFLAVEDLLTAFRGGKSVIGDFMTGLIGDTNWKRLSELPNKLGDVMFELGYGKERLKKEGRKQTGALDLAAPFGGKDADKLRSVERKSGIELQRNKEQNQAAALAAPPSTFWAPLMNMLGADPQKVLASEHASGVRMSAQSNARSREELGLPLVGEIRQGNTIINVNADVSPETADRVKRAVREAQQETWRNVHESTNRSPRR